MEVKMASFDRWMQNQKHRESTRRRNTDMRCIVRDCMRGDYAEIDRVWYSQDLINIIRDVVRVSAREAELLYEAWQLDAARQR